MAICLAEPQHQESSDDCDPVDIVRNDGAISGRVVPTKESVKDAPAASTVELRAAALEEDRSEQDLQVLLLTLTYVNVPDATVDIIGARTVAELGCITANQLVPLLSLEEPDTS